MSKVCLGTLPNKTSSDLSRGNEVKETNPGREKSKACKGGGNLPPRQKKQEYHYDLFKDGAWEAALSELAPPSLEKEGTKLLRLNKLLGNLISSGEPELPNPFLDKA